MTDEGLCYQVEGKVIESITNLLGHMKSTVNRSRANTYSNSPQGLHIFRVIGTLRGHTVIENRK